MRLVSATVKNYRIHRDTTVEFDSCRTVIGGPNESGKSTFVEAVHRGLFLKSRVTGDLRNEMLSLTSQGVPQAEVLFEMDGKRYRITKEFNGPRGTTTLTQIGGYTLSGEEAELKMAELLGAGLVSGKASRDRLISQWVHLWVWQGRGMEDPTEDAQSQNENLIRRLQEVGGAVAKQSERDSRVAEHFANRANEIFTAKGQPRKGSELYNAQEGLRKTEETLREARERFESLKKTREEYTAALQILERAEEDLKGLTRQLEEATSRQKELERLRQKEQLRLTELQSAEKELKGLEEAENRIKELSAKIKALTHSLEPKREQKEQLEALLADARKRREEAEARYQKAIETTRQCRAEQDLAAALRSLFEKQARLGELKSRWEKIEGLQGEKAALEQRLAGLPQVAKPFLKKLRKIEGELKSTQAALDAMAAELEVVRSPEKVRVDHKVLSAGESVRLTEVAQVEIGDGVELKIHPGGGEELQKRREDKRKLENSLQKMLGDKSLASLEEAEAALVEREGLESEVKEKESAIAALDPQNTRSQMEEAEKEVAASQGEVERRSKQLENPAIATTLEEAETLLDHARRRVEEAESEERGLKRAFDAARKEEGDCEEKLDSLVKELTKDEHELVGCEAALKQLVEQCGDGDQRSKALSESRVKVAGLRDQLEKIREEIERLNPEALEGDLQRLTRACDEKGKAIQEAKGTIVACGAILKSSGDQDPKARLEEAGAAFEFAQKRFKRVELRSMAISMVSELFRQKQKELSTSLSQPLADRITDYLRRIFPNAQAQVEMDGTQLGGIKLVRTDQGGGSAFSFDGLSGGTKEQMAAAVRLAIAELLAEEHGGSLPVVFDDAFVNTDPDRVEAVQRMLDLAAERGLQVIVLTSNPSDYASLGAKEVPFTRAV